MKNKDIDDLLKSSLTPLADREHGSSITDQVMAAVAQPRPQVAAPGSLKRDVVLLVGLLVGLGTGAPALMDLAALDVLAGDVLAGLSSIVGLIPELPGLPDFGTSGSAQALWMQWVNPTLLAASLAAGAMALLLLFPALDD